MTKIEAILPAPAENQKAFILDHGKIEDGQLKYADDLTSYGWNVKRYNKLKEGAFVLNRRSGKLTKDRKFEIYGGGYVDSISEPDEDGNVTAVITNPFIIDPPIRQGDSFIENFKWKTKNKRPNSWIYFWNQYGMNEISFKEFTDLIKDQHCYPAEAHYEKDTENDLTEDEIKDLEIDSSDNFTVILDEIGPVNKDKKTERKFKASKIDFDSINKAKQKIGALGEAIVFELLQEQAKETNGIMPIHASKVEGDGLGYDIRSWDKDGNELHIEVKASTSKYSDGFQMTRNEVAASVDPGSIYKVYFVHDLDVETKRCKIEIYEGPFTEENFKMQPMMYKIYKK